MNFTNQDMDKLMKDLNKLSNQKKSIMQFLHNSPIGIYIIQNNKFICSNQKFQEITGYSEDDLKKMNPIDLVIPEDREKVHENAVQMLRGVKKEPYNYRIKDKKGDMKWIIETVSSYYNEEQRSVLGNFMDITEGEKIRDALIKSPIGIYIVQDSMFKFTNAVFKEITEYNEEELLKKKSMDIVFKDDQEFVYQKAVNMLKGNEKDPYSFRIKTKKFKTKWVMETVISIIFNGKKAVLGNFLDITESKEIEKKVLESEQKYRSLFEMAQEGIVIIDYFDGKIIDANPEFQRQTDYGIFFLKQKKIWDIQPEEFREEAKKSFYRFKEKGGGIASWKLCQKREGKVLPVEIVAQRMKMEEQDVVFCLVRDISEREAMMSALRAASEEWRRCFDVLDDCVVLISKDFKIQRANLATAKLLDMDIRSIVGKNCFQLFHGTSSPPSYCPHLKAMEKDTLCQAEANEKYLNKILQFSSAPMKDEEDNLKCTVEVISDITLKREQEQESIRLSKALAESFEGITESLSDLAESRDPYTAGHSRHVAKLAALAGKEMKLGEKDLQGLHIASILHDIGKAIIPAGILNKPGKLSLHEWGLIKQHPVTAYETLKHIPFPWPIADVVHQHHERLDGSGYPRGLCYTEIHLWAKIIAVADLVDAMTSHRPYRPGLPRQKAINEIIKGKGIIYDPKVCDALLSALQLLDRRILVVDHNSEILDEIVTELKISGLEPRGYTDSQTAFELFKKKPFPLSIIEMKMPAGDGIELSQKIKEISPEAEIIMMTKNINKEDTLRVLRSGASDLLEKPLDSEIFKKSVNRALQRFAGKLK